MEFYIWCVSVNAMVLRNWIIAEDITVGWRVWPLMLLALALWTLTFHNYFALHRELKLKAARADLIVTGGPTLLVSCLTV